MSPRKGRSITTPSARPLVVWLFANRERAVICLGAVLLLAMFGAVMAAILFGRLDADVLTSAFMLLLGYFFGQHKS